MFVHEPVLLEEVLATLNEHKEELVFVDATLGEGGHAEAFLSKNPRLILIGIERDKVIMERARGRLGRFGERVRLFRMDYREFFRSITELVEQKEVARAALSRLSAPRKAQESPVASTGPASPARELEKPLYDSDPVVRRRAEKALKELEAGGDREAAEILRQFTDYFKVISRHLLGGGGIDAVQVGVVNLIDPRRRIVEAGYFANAFLGNFVGLCAHDCDPVGHGAS